MPDYTKTLEFMRMEQEFTRRTMEAAKNFPYPFLVNTSAAEPATDFSWQPLLFGPPLADGESTKE